MKSFSSVCSPTFSPNSKTRNNKKPRTVHIDVYCTGSESEEKSSDYTDSLDNQLNRLESNSTQQTVFDSDRLKLRHTRIAKEEKLPRRIAINDSYQSDEINHYTNLREYFLSQNDSQDEVFQPKLTNLKDSSSDNIRDDSPHIDEKQNRTECTPNYSNLSKELSDDCISSGYPNSSQSTVRDLTCSSISSALGCMSSANLNELESSWKETEVDNWSIRPSDSFDLEEPSNQCRSEQSKDFPEGTENNWKSLNSNNIHNHIGNMQLMNGLSRDSDNRVYKNNQLDTISSIKVDNSMPTQIKECAGGDDEARKIFNRGQSVDLSQRTTQRNNFTRRNYSFRSNTEKNTSIIQRLIPGYTREHLLRAQKFGSVIEAIKKPGHHVGPAKNPDCCCEYCRRWYAERGYNRGRASSLDITFIDFR